MYKNSGACINSYFNFVKEDKPYTPDIQATNLLNYKNFNLTKNQKFSDQLRPLTVTTFDTR